MVLYHTQIFKVIHMLYTKKVHFKLFIQSVLSSTFFFLISKNRDKVQNKSTNSCLPKKYNHHNGRLFCKHLNHSLFYMTLLSPFLSTTIFGPVIFYHFIYPLMHCHCTLVLIIIFTYFNYFLKGCW